MSALDAGNECIEIIGFKCSLFCDPEKSLEVNRGSLLVPWANDKGLLIDR